MKTRVIAILDRSGSMGSVLQSTITGYNEFVSSLKGDISFDLVLFDDQIEYPEIDKPLAKVPKLTTDSYVPRGLTALRDAVCQTLSVVSLKKNEKGVVLIMTDGQENASREYSDEEMKALIRKKEKDGWVFTYMGANQDSWESTKTWGFQRGNVTNYVASAAGTAEAFRTMSLSTNQFVVGNISNDFYVDTTKKKK
jgi:hypothetical protein